VKSKYFPGGQDGARSRGPGRIRPQPASASYSHPLRRDACHPSTGWIESHRLPGIPCLEASAFAPAAYHAGLDQSQSTQNYLEQRHYKD
jgi:hypothetical protein